VRIRVKETSTTLAGSDKEITVAARIPEMTGTVSISGTATFGQELTADPNLTNGGTVTYQWKRGSVDISGATSSTYTLVQADIGSIITVVATADGIAGTGSITSDGTASVTKAVGPSAPSESIVGQFPSEATSIELSALAANASGLEAAVAINGSTYGSYADLSVDGDGKATISSLSNVTTATKVRIRVKETSTTLAGSDKEITVAAKIPEMTGTVSITGTAAYGEELTAVPNLTNGGTVTYQWQRDSVDITGATSSSYTLFVEQKSRFIPPPSDPASTYTLVQADIGSIITVVATADGIAGTGSITSDGTASVTKAVGPSAPSESIVGQFPSEATSIELSAFSASATGLEAAVAINGSTYGSYADLSVDGDGKATISGLSSVTASTKVRIRVKETATTLAGSDKEITVAAKIPEMTGTVSITGTAAYGQVLTAVPNLTNGGTVTYQWQRDSVDISGATSSTYTLVQADIGSIITVVATADGIAGTGSITSDGTASVTKAVGPSAPSESIVGQFPSEATSIELSAFSASATGLEAAVAINGSTYGSYADLSVDGDGKATITGLSGVSTATKVSIRVKETATTLAGAYKEISVTEISVSYEVGDIGPSGGYIFYVDTVDDFDWTYLEAAPYGWYQGATDSNGAYSGDDDPSFEWGSYGYIVSPSARGTAIGTGETNTANIVSYHDGLGTAYPEKGDYYTNATQYSAGNDGTVAAKVCADYTMTVEGVTYDDWFLPSKNELDLIYDNLKVESLGGFFADKYWSSSEFTGFAAGYQYFVNGSQDGLHKVNNFRVRPVRAF
jgi:DNA polymerase III sliding clamp (beta) subunit (PCNA family)